MKTMRVSSRKTRLLSILVATLVFGVVSGLAVVIFRGMAARNLLESQNDCERTINVLFSSLRNYDSFGSAIEEIPILHEKIVGISVFNADRALLYTWGTAPSSYPSVEFAGGTPTGLMEEMYIGNPKANSQIVLVRPLRPPGSEENTPPREPRPRDTHHENSFTSTIFRQAELIYLQIRQPRYWQEKRLQGFLFPVTEALLLFIVGFVWLLILKNAEYRSEAERQKNLVMLGTAASTLAHEIKNPLLAIRLQTGILSRILSGDGGRELSIIDAEVERLSQLSTRVNDVLRDPVGVPENIDPFDIALETGIRLCGRQIVSGTATPNNPDRIVRMDVERLRSIIENLVRNALESGGPAEQVTIEISIEGGHVLVDVLDRGSGIAPREREKAFDPFFTTKSRGTGIGLAICRRFARAAGGDVTFTDRSGGGLLARLTLPRAGS